MLQVRSNGTNVVNDNNLDEKLTAQSLLQAHLFVRRSNAQSRIPAHRGTRQISWSHGFGELVVGLGLGLPGLVLALVKFRTIPDDVSRRSIFLNRRRWSLWVARLHSLVMPKSAR